MMEQLLVRILLAYQNGTEIAYLYNRESFELLNIERQTFDKSQFLEIGQIIEYNNRRYIVRSMNFKMESQFFNIDPDVGINLYSPTDPSDFNCQIGVFVDDEE